MISFVIVLLAQTGFILHQVAFLEERLGSLTAAGATLSLTAIGSIVARLIVGRLFADRVDLRILTVIMFLVQGTAALAVIHIDHPVSTFVSILIFGFTIGNVYMLQSLLTSDVFGYVSFGAVYGLIAMATQISSGLGPLDDRGAGRSDRLLRNPADAGRDPDLRRPHPDLLRQAARRDARPSDQPAAHQTSPAASGKRQR